MDNFIYIPISQFFKAHSTFLKVLSERFNLILSHKSELFDLNMANIRFLDDIIETIDLNEEKEKFFAEEAKYYEYVFSKSEIILDRKIVPSDYNHLSAQNRQKLLNAFNEAEKFKRLIKKRKIDLVIVSAEYSWVSRCIVVVAKKNGIPVINIEHGFFGSMNLPSAYKDDYPRVWKFQSDYVIANNLLESHVMDSWNQDKTAERFIQFGSYLDAEISKRIESEDARKILGINNNHVITLFGTWVEVKSASAIFQSQIDEVNFYKLIFNSLKEFSYSDSFTVIVKLHPAFEYFNFDAAKKYINNLAENYGIKNVLIIKDKLEEIFAVTDFTICSNYSSILWQSIEKNIPAGLIVPSEFKKDIQPDKLVETNELANADIMSFLNKPEEIRAFIKRYSNNDERLYFTERVSEFCNKWEITNSSVEENCNNICNWINGRVINKKSKRMFSIIILTYNSSKTILNCINSVWENIDSNDEVIIVDNKSSDNTTDLVKEVIKEKKQFKLIENNYNIGFSAGCNVGIKNSSGQYVVLLNPDTIVTPNWLNNLEYHLQDEEVAAVGPLSNYVAGLQKAELYLKEELVNANIQEISSKLYEWNQKKSVNTKLLVGFCMIVKRSALEVIGLLDEDLFLGNDDLDISWKLRLKGYNLKVALDSFVYHEGQHSFNTVKKSKTDLLVQESTDMLYSKLEEHYGKGNVPTPEELWGMNWFHPTNADFNENARLPDVNEVKVLEKKLDKKNLSCIILTYNQLEYTKLFYDSIKDYINDLFELITIDNASVDDTKNFLKNLCGKNVKVVLNEENVGFPAGVNQGLKLAKANYILIANNDIIIPPKAIERMIDVAESDPCIGIVGPVSNEVSGFQIDKNAKYSSIEEMFLYAEEKYKNASAKTVEFPRVAFLCTLIKKEVIEKIGGLDERFSPGNFEDDDFCLRAQLAGYKTVIAQDVFIHHYGSKSFKADGEKKYLDRLEKNRQIFIDKWGKDPDQIWLKGEEFKRREIRIPLNKNIFIESFERANILIQEEDYKATIPYLENCIKNYEKNDNLSVTKEQIELLLEKIKGLLYDK